MKTILNAKQLEITVDRLCHQLIENHGDFANTVLLGLQPRGVWLGNRIHNQLRSILPGADIRYGKIDITFYRDDFSQKGKHIQVPNETAIKFSIANKKVVLIDDVLYTGRSTRAALDAMMDFGRPSSVELLALIDRRFSRELPIQATYVGRTVDANVTENVKVLWTERDGRDEVVLA